MNIRFLFLFFLILFYSSFSQSENIQVDFKQADIRSLIDTVSQITGKNFVVDPRVKGRVTLSFPEGISSDDLFQTFLSVLSVHGYAVVPNGDVNRIVPVSLAKTLGNSKTFLPESFSTYVFSLSHASVKEVSGALRPLLSKNGELIAIESSNKVIVTDNTVNVARLRSLMSRIDSPLDLVAEVIRVNNQPVEELYNSLSLLYSSSSKKRENLPFSFNASSNTIILFGDSSVRSTLRRLIFDLDKPSFSLTTSKIYDLQHINISDLTDFSFFDESIKVEFLEASNQVVVSGVASNVLNAMSLLSRMDSPIQQLMIQSVFVEVGEDFLKQLGLDFGFNSGSMQSLFNLSGLMSGLSSLSQIGANIDFTGSDWGVFLKALESNTQVNILSTPSVIALNNRESSIVIGREVPFQTGTYSNSNAQGSTIERHSVGIKLSVTPNVNSSGLIRLLVDQEISDVLPKGEAVDIQTTKRSIKTQAILEDGQVLALGGLFSQRSSYSERSVPFLSDVPLVGGLFSDTERSSERVNLLVFIKPTLIFKGSSFDFPLSAPDLKQIKKKVNPSLPKVFDIFDY